MSALHGNELLETLNGADLPDWQGFDDGLRTRLKTGSFAKGLELVDAIGAAAEEANHHPDVSLTYPHVDIRLVSHDKGGVTQRDLDMARTVSALAAERGITADRAAPVVLDLALDTAGFERIAPFWSAVLTGSPDNLDGDEIREASDQVPLMWFQRAEPHEAGHQRFHLDLRIGADQAQARIDAALAAGGTLVDDSAAPSFWVLADADGNKVCICTIQSR